MPKYHDLQSNYHFQPVAIETTSVYGKSTAPYLSGLAKKLLICLVTPGSASGSTSACLWQWSEDMLPAYWPVCKIDFIFICSFLAVATDTPVDLEI